MLNLRTNAIRGETARTTNIAVFDGFLEPPFGFVSCRKETKYQASVPAFIYEIRVCTYPIARDLRNSRAIFSIILRQDNGVAPGGKHERHSAVLLTDDVKAVFP